MRTIGSARGVSVAQMALAWLLHQPVVSSVIVGAKRADQLADNIAATQVDLSAERLLVAVSDSGTRGAVTRAHAETLSSRGRGLGLIEELSDAWGTDPAVRGSTVWFEIGIRASNAA